MLVHVSLSSKAGDALQVFVEIDCKTPLGSFRASACVHCLGVEALVKACAALLLACAVSQISKERDMRQIYEREHVHLHAERQQHHNVGLQRGLQHTEHGEHVYLCITHSQTCLSFQTYVALSSRFPTLENAGTTGRHPVVFQLSPTQYPLYGGGGFGFDPNA